MPLVTTTQLGGIDMTMVWKIVTDGERDFHALQDNNKPEDRAFVFFDGENGFGENPGCVLVTGLKEVAPGKLGR